MSNADLFKPFRKLQTCKIPLARQSGRVHWCVNNAQNLKSVYISLMQFIHMRAAETTFLKREANTKGRQMCSSKDRQ